MKMFFVLVTIIALKPSIDGKEPAFVPGDVIKSTFVGASDTLDRCEKAAELTAEGFNRHTNGSSLVVAHCVELDASIGDHLGFEPTK